MKMQNILKNQSIWTAVIVFCYILMGCLKQLQKMVSHLGWIDYKTPLKIHGDKKIDKLRDEVVNALCDHAGGKLEHDDVTLLLLEIR